MNFNKKLAAILVFSALLALSLGMASAQTSDENNGSFDIPGGLVQDSNAKGPVANVGAEYKFDGGLYQKIQSLILEEPQAGDFGVYDGERYYNVIMVVSRDDGDGRDPDETARENKDSIVRYLNTLGARDIIAAESLSFVTASIPVTEIPGFSLHEEIYQMGDGELPVTVKTDTARQTIHAASSDLRQSIGRIPDGTGVVVAVVDTGINSTYLNSKVINRVYCDERCREQPSGIIMGMNKTHYDLYSEYDYDQILASHGTQVAQVIAASGMSHNNGMAPGVTLLDAMLSREDGTSNFLSGLAHSIDWSYSRGADVVNVSVGISTSSCGAISAISYGMIINEAVDKGMVVVDAAGNSGLRSNLPYYETVISPACAHNTIAVGGINDRGSEITMYTRSSRGPTHDSEPRLAPHIVAPAHNIQTLDYTNSAATSARSGTSIAAPQVSAAAAMMLQVNPELTPAEVKAALLLGASWTGPIPCTSLQYEQNNASDNCSYARNPRDFDTANNAASLGILNNVGFGILDVAESLRYVNSASPHIVSDYYAPQPRDISYGLSVTDASKPVKLLLTWMVHAHGGIAEQRYRGNVHVENLNFHIVPPVGSALAATSVHQTTEFIVFDPPAVGTHSVFLSSRTPASQSLSNKPIQAFTLASSVPITPFSSNQPPMAQPNTMVVSPGMEVPIRLRATDSDGDAVTFHVSQDPAKGTVTTDELITTTTSRVIYAPEQNFAGADTFQVTPYDGAVLGTPATITLVAESLPPLAADTDVDTTNIKDWDSYEITRGFDHVDYSHVFLGKRYPVSALYMGSVNMEGIDLKITTTGGNTYTIAIPSNGDRMIEFASPITIQRAVLSVDGIDEETSRLNRGTAAVDQQIVTDYNDVRVMIGYVRSSCTTATTGAVSACPAQSTYSATTYPDMQIYERSTGDHTSSTMRVTKNGPITALSVSVDIDHKWIGDLGVYLISPDGTSVTLHDRSGGHQDDIATTYSSSTNTALADLVGSQLAGNWTLLVDDYIPGISGKLNHWSISATYLQGAISQASVPSEQIIFSDDFELPSGHAVKWTEAGEGYWNKWPVAHVSAPQLPGGDPINYVLQSHICDTCTVTLKNPINLTEYSSATLSFWRLVDWTLDEGEYLKTELYDGSRWNTIHVWSDGTGDDNTWHHESYNLAPYLDTSNFKMRFVAKQNDVNEHVMVDGVVIKATQRTSSG